MIRKFLVIASLAVCMAGVTACQNTPVQQNNVVEQESNIQQENQENKTENTGAESGSSETSATESNSEADSGGADQNTESKIPLISINADKKSWYAEDGVTELLNVETPILTVENDGFEAFKSLVEGTWGGLGNNNFEDLRNMAKEHYEGLGAEGKQYFSAYSITEQVDIAKCDEKIVSFRCCYYDYIGGAHGNGSVSGMTIDVAAAKELELADILSDAEGFYAKAIPYITEKLEAEYSDMLFPDYKDSVANTFSDKDFINWYMDGAGVVIVYNSYEVGPYVMGSPQITLPYGEFKDFIKSEYITAGDEMVAKIPGNEDFSEMIGASQSISVMVSTDENYMDKVNLVSGSTNIELGTFGWFSEAYLINRADGRSFLLLVCDYMSTDMVTFVYEVTDGNFVECAKLTDAEISGSYISPKAIEMNVYLDVLGSYIGSMRYTIGENGELVQKDDVFVIDSKTPLTLIKTLPAMIEGQNVTIDAGEQIVVIGTNDINEVYFKMADSDVTGTIFYETDSVDIWKKMIDGVWENEYFEMLPYAD